MDGAFWALARVRWQWSGIELPGADVGMVQTHVRKPIFCLNFIFTKHQTFDALALSICLRSRFLICSPEPTFHCVPEVTMGDEHKVCVYVLFNDWPFMKVTLLNLHPVCARPAPMSLDASIHPACMTCSQSACNKMLTAG